MTPVLLKTARRPPLFSSWPIFFRLLSVMLLVSLVPLIFSIGFSTTLSTQEILAQTRVSLSRLAFSTAQRYDQYHAGNYTFLRALRLDPAVSAFIQGNTPEKEPSKAPAIYAVIQRGLQANRANDLIGVYNDQGLTLAHTAPASVGRDFSVRDWVRACDEGKEYTAALQVGLTTDLLGYTACVPVKEGNQTIGLIANRVTGSFATDILRESLAVQSGEISDEARGAYRMYLVNPQGVVMACSTDSCEWQYRILGTLPAETFKAIVDGKVLGHLCPDGQAGCKEEDKKGRQPQAMPALQSLGTAIVSAAQRRETGSIRYCRPADLDAPRPENPELCANGTWHVVGYAPITVADQPTAWMMVLVDVPEAQFTQAVERERGQSLTLAGAVGLVVLLLTLLTAQSITQPLRFLTGAVQRAETERDVFGTPQYKRLLNRDDELGRLARSFRDTLTANWRLLVEAQEANRLKDEFMATMSHELRTPFNAIINAIDLVLRGVVGPLTDKQTKLLTTALTAAREKLFPLIESILDHARLEAGRMALVSKPIQPQSLLEKSIEDWQAAYSQKGVTLRLVLRPEQPAGLTGDARRIAQVLDNLLNNACKFTPSNGSVTVTSTLENGQWRIDVTDTGIGISQADLPTIFQPFRQADGSLTRAYGGSGLGLTIARKLTELMGGVLSVVSVVGTGSTFTLVLPLAAPQEPRL